VNPSKPTLFSPQRRNPCAKTPCGLPQRACRFSARLPSKLVVRVPLIGQRGELPNGQRPLAAPPEHGKGDKRFSQVPLPFVRVPGRGKGVDEVATAALAARAEAIGHEQFQGAEVRRALLIGPIVLPAERRQPGDRQR
jgi:hypothetical protein